MNVGFIPGLGQAAMIAAKYLPLKPMSKLVANVVMALDMQRVNPLFRNTHHVSVHRGAWGTNGSYTLQARFREFMFIRPRDRTNPFFKFWHGI